MSVYGVKPFWYMEQPRKGHPKPLKFLRFKPSTNPNIESYDKTFPNSIGKLGFVQIPTTQNAQPRTLHVTFEPKPRALTFEDTRHRQTPATTNHEPNTQNPLYRELLQNFINPFPNFTRQRPTTTRSMPGPSAFWLPRPKVQLDRGLSPCLCVL